MLNEQTIMRFLPPLGAWIFTVSVTSLIFLFFSLSKSSRQKFTRVDFYFVLLHEASRSFFRVILSPVTFLLLLGLFWRGDIAKDFSWGWSASVPVWAQVVLAFLVVDFTDYWIHRMMHRPFFWPVHVIHHAPEHLSGWTYFRSHPLQYVPFRIRSLAMLPLGFSPEALFINPVFHWVLVTYAHSDWKFNIGFLKYVLNNPHFHRWHHSSHPEAIDKNFSTILPVWDWLFGTLYMPKGVDAHSLGVAGIPEGLWAQVWYPFRGKAMVPEAALAVDRPQSAP